MAPAKDLTSIDIYAEALRGAGLDPPKAIVSSMLQILVSRDAIGLELKAGTSQPDQLDRIVALDKSLRDAAPRLIRLMSRDLFAQWRASRLPEAGAWWWFLDMEPAKRRWYQLPLTILAWVAVAVSISVIVEDLRRLLGPSSDGLSTAVQALLAFLIGGTAIQYAKQLLDMRKEEAGSSYGSPRSRIYFAVAVTLGAGLLEWQRSTIANYFTQRGTEYAARDRPKALAAYQRASALNQDSADAHINLAFYYEEILDFEKAETEYLASIRADNSIPPAYEALARLAMYRRKDYRNAIRFCGIGLSAAERAQPGGWTTADVIKHWKYRLYVDRAWARLQTGANVDANGDLQSALAVQPVDSNHHYASAYCLLAQLNEKQRKWDDEDSNKQTCRTLSTLDEHKQDIQPDWLSFSNEPTLKHIAGQGGKSK